MNELAEDKKRYFNFKKEVVSNTTKIGMATVVVVPVLIIALFVYDRRIDAKASLLLLVCIVAWFQILVLLRYIVLLNRGPVWIDSESRVGFGDQSLCNLRECTGWNLEHYSLQLTGNTQFDYIVLITPNGKVKIPAAIDSVGEFVSVVYSRSKILEHTLPTIVKLENDYLGNERTGGRLNLRKTITNTTTIQGGAIYLVNSRNEKENLSIPDIDRIEIYVNAGAAIQVSIRSKKELWTQLPIGIDSLAIIHAIKSYQAQTKGNAEIA